MSGCHARGSAHGIGCSSRTCRREDATIVKSGEVAGLSALKAPWRIGIDVGGTFTDLVLTDSEAVSRVVKVPSIPTDPSQGVLAALARLAGDLHCTVEDVLRDCTLFVHGSTVATNRMIEGK